MSKRVLKVFSITLSVLLLVGLVGYLLFKNMQLNQSYKSATQQVTQLQAKLDAVGTFTDVYTVKTEVKMGQEIKQEDLILQTVPTSSVPVNVIGDASQLIGNYYRIGIQPGVTLTADFVVKEEYIGSVYERDVFLDSIPVGTKVGDYVDVRVVLPGGEEFVVFPHKRVNARYENAVKMKFDEADLWLYTSMMVDRALYKPVGFKVYCTKYVDPGAHDKTVAYFPVRKEVVDIMNISGNLTDKQKARMWNENLRASIDAKLNFYDDPLNKKAPMIADSWREEEGRYNKAEEYYESLLEEINNNGGELTTASGLVDPTSPPVTGTPNEDLGTLEPIPPSQETPNTDGQKDQAGNGNVVPNQDILDSQGDNLFDDESPIT